MGGRRGGIRVLFKLTWIELKLFLREPTTLVFTFAFPVVLLFVLGEVFGNQPGGTDRRVFGDIGAMNYYVPAYIAVVAMSVGVIMLPARLTGYRAGGVLRRFQASLVPVWAVLGSQVLAALVLSVVLLCLLRPPAGAPTARTPPPPESPPMPAIIFVPSADIAEEFQCSSLFPAG